MHDESVGPYVGASLVSFRFEKIGTTLSQFKLSISHEGFESYEPGFTRATAVQVHTSALSVKLFVRISMLSPPK